MSTELIIVIIIAVTVIFVVMLWQGMSIAKTEIGSKQTVAIPKNSGAGCKCRTKVCGCAAKDR